MSGYSRYNQAWNQSPVAPSIFGGSESDIWLDDFSTSFVPFAMAYNWQSARVPDILPTGVVVLNGEGEKLMDIYGICRAVPAKSRDAVPAVR